AALPGCGNLDNSEADDAELQPADGKADGVKSTSTYYSVRRDERKCAWPACGQYWVKRVNFSTTTCQDGVKRAECYVVDFDVENGLGLDADEASQFRSDAAAGKAILRGSIKPATYNTQTPGFFEPADTSCGGFVGKVCPDGQICDITIENACAGADLPGTCKVQPQLCFDLYKPVCGCDGRTYGNDCNRLGAGVQLDHQGACN